MTFGFYIFRDWYLSFKIRLFKNESNSSFMKQTYWVLWANRIGDLLVIVVCYKKRIVYSVLQNILQSYRCWGHLCSSKLEADHIGLWKRLETLAMDTTPWFIMLLCWNLGAGQWLLYCKLINSLDVRTRLVWRLETTTMIHTFLIIYVGIMPFSTSHCMLWCHGDLSKKILELCCLCLR